MWSSSIKATLTAATLLVLASGQANAAVIDVDVQFPFLVQGRQFSAGHYEIRPEDSDPAILAIRGGDNGTGAAAFVLTTQASGKDPAGEKPALQFDRYENQYRLVSIWESPGDGHQVPAHR